VIFACVGTNPFEFERFVKIVDGLHAIDSSLEVCLQIGFTSYTPTNYKYEKFVNLGEYHKYVSQCDVFIAHAGTGVSIDAMKHRKNLILIPRYGELNEHTDNHQLELAKYWEEQNRAFVIYKNDGSDALHKKIVEARSTRLNPERPNKELLIKNINKYILEIDGAIK